MATNNSSLTSYVLPTLDVFKDADEQATALRARGIKTQVREEPYQFRLVPPLPGRDAIHVFGQHWCQTGPNSKVLVLCGVAAKPPLPCYVHHLLKDFANSDNAIDRRRADASDKDSWVVKQRYAVVVVDRENEDAGPQPWDFPWSIYDQLKKLKEKASRAGINLWDPTKNGIDLLLSVSKDKANFTSYHLSLAVDRSSLAKSAAKREAIIVAQPDLRKEYPILSLVEQEAKIRGTEAPTGGWTPPGGGSAGTVRDHMRSTIVDEDEDETPARAAAHGDDEDEEDEDE